VNRVTRQGGVVASAVTQFLGGMSAFDLMINTAAVFDASPSALAPPWPRSLSTRFMAINALAARSYPSRTG
jgi:hypothetical protein